MSTCWNGCDWPLRMFYRTCRTRLQLREALRTQYGQPCAHIKRFRRPKRCETDSRV